MATSSANVVTDGNSDEMKLQQAKTRYDRKGRYCFGKVGKLRA
jgi:hypothetical protein